MDAFSKIFIPFFTIVVVFFSCASSKEKDAKNKSIEITLANGHQLIDAQIVEKALVMKNAKVSSHTDLYVRRNIQDYFIKFCDGPISKKVLEQALIMKDGISQSLKLEIEIRDGLWDSCDPDEIVQSRTGKYMVIYAIIKQ